MSGDGIERIHYFKNLGASLNEGVNSDQQTEAGIEITRGALTRMQKFLCNQSLKHQTDFHILWC